MTNPTDTSHQDGVFFETLLPLSWSLVSHPVPSFILDEWMQTNITILRALSTMEALPIDKENELGATAAKAIDRLEAKIDLSLTLLAKLLVQNTAFPQAVAVTLSGSSVKWINPEGPTLGNDVTLSLYLSHRIPQPLILPAKVTSSEIETDGLHTSATFTDLSAEMQDWLERTIFRYHRRSIQQRHSGK